MDFSEFDKLAHWFWKKPITQINEGIEDGYIKDSIGSSGITLVIGCPLPKEIQRKILKIRSKFDKLLKEETTLQVKWRDDLSSLHITVYGLVKPEDYKRGESWPLKENVLKAIKDVVSNTLDFNLVLQGVGILGIGAVGIRISNSDTLSQIRKGISKIQGMSEYGEKRGEGVNKIMIGRFLTSFSESSMQIVKRIVDDLRDFPIGEMKVNNFELVHYKHEFLDRLYEQNSFL